MSSENSSEKDDDNLPLELMHSRHALPFWTTGFRCHVVRRGGTSDKPAVECFVVHQYDDNESHQLVEERLKKKSSGIWSQLQESDVRVILLGQEEFVSHQPRQTGDTKQHSQTGFHNVAAGSGVVLPTTSTGDGASVHKSMVVITDSVWLHCHDYMFHYGREMYKLQTLVQEAENKGYKTTVVILNYNIMKEIYQLLRLSDTLIILIDTELEPAIDITDAFNFVLESTDMDTRHQSLLNNFGLVRHAILKSSRDPQQGVHVVYDTHSTDFVLSNMKEKLETRTGLRLVLPDLKHDVLSVKESPFLATLAQCRNTLVVDYSHYGMCENLLRQAVKEAEHPDGRTVFIQRGRQCRDWVLNKLETSTLMIYPHDAGHQFNRKTDFWTTVAAFLESADMDTRHQRLLNNFGPIRHAILTSSRDPQQGVHVVYDIHSTDFVLSNMKEELETRTGLRLVLPDLKHDVLYVKESPFLATLALCRNTLVVLGDTLDEVHENTLQQAVKDAKHPDGRTVFIQRGSSCPDWVLNKLGTSTLMIYPHDAGRQLNRKTDFWPAVAAYLEDVDTDPHQRNLLNSFGPVRHVLLTSSHDPQRGVHVVYDVDSSNFVLTELKQEVEKRTNLTLILPDVNHNPLSEQEDQLDVEHNTLSVKGNEFLAKLASCRKTCVVFGAEPSLFPMYETFLPQALSGRYRYGNIGADRSPFPMYEIVLQQAVKEAEYAGSQIVFLQRVETCPDWVLNRLETCIVMMYPEYRSQPGEPARFWRTLAAVFETSDMDLHHQRFLNSFGPVRHAALTSSRDPQQGVHVVYDAESSNFVLIGLKEEMEARTGLRLVLPDMEHKALSEKGNQLEKTLTMKGTEFCAILALCRKTCVVLNLGNSRSGVYDKVMQQAVKEAEHPDGRTVFIQRGKTCPDWVLDRKETCTDIKYFRTKRTFYELEREFWKPLTACIGSKIEIQNAGSDVAKQTEEARDKQSTQYQCLELCSEDNSQGKLELESENCGSEYSESSSSQSVPMKFIGPVTNPDSDTDEEQRTHPFSLPPPSYVTTAPRAESQIPSAEDTSEGKSTTDAQRVQNQTPLQPIFSSKWQSVDTVTSNGGTVRKRYSDVILTVPADALDEDSQADVHTAVCTDVDRVRRVVKLSEDECVSSPVAEYWAGHEFRFKKPVTIRLPHFLPPDPDPSLVRVYRVTRRPDGQFIVTRLNPGERSDCTPETGESQDWNEDGPFEGCAASKASSVQSVHESEHTEKPAEGVVWEKTGYFWLSSADHITVITDHFSAYVCTYCGKNQGPPVLKAMACGSHYKDSQGQWVVHISLHVWDRRLKILDFQEEFGVPIYQAIGKRSFSLRGFAGPLKESKLHVRLELDEEDQWQFRQRSNGNPIKPVSQCRNIDYFLSCDNETCAVVLRERTCPAHYDWVLQSKSTSTLEPLLQFYLDISIHPVEQTSGDDGDDVTTDTWPLKYPKSPDQSEPSMPMDGRSSPPSPPVACGTNAARTSTYRGDCNGHIMPHSRQNGPHDTEMKEAVSVSPPQSQWPAPCPLNMPATVCMPTQTLPFAVGQTEWRGQHSFSLQQSGRHPTHNGASDSWVGAASSASSQSHTSASSGNPFLSSQHSAQGFPVGNQSELSSGLSQAMPLSPSQVNCHENGMEVQSIAPGNTVPANTTGTPPGAAGGGTCNQYWHNHPVVINNNNFHINKIQGSPNFASTVTTHHKHRGESSGNSDLHALGYAPLQALQGLRDNDTDIPESFHEEYNAERTDEVRSPSLNSQHGAYFSDTRNPVCNPSQ